MDSREQPPPSQPQPPPVTSQLQLHNHHHQLQQQMISSYPHTMINHSPTPNPNTVHNPNSAPSGGFPFNSMGSQASHAQTQNPSRPQPKVPSESAGMVLDVSSPPSSGMGFCIEPAKKKRGRPRKYTPDGNIALGLSPISSGAVGSIAYGDSTALVSTTGGSSEQSAKRSRGRPPGSGKKQLDALGGVGGVGFTPHVITVNAGEDVASKIMAFSQQGPRTVCILSANGAICNVTLRQPATSGGAISYEGRYEIISLSGSYFFTQDNGHCGNGDLSVSLAAPDGRVIGGGVAGMLMAASTVQVIVGSFVTDTKKSNTKNTKQPTPAPQLLGFGAPLTGSKPPSHGPSSESSDENGCSPLNRDSPFYTNSDQPIHNVPIPMYPIWATQNPQ